MKDMNAFTFTIPVIFAIFFIGCAGGEPEPLPGSPASAQPQTQTPTQRSAPVKRVSVDSLDAPGLLQAVYENYATMESFQAQGTSNKVEPLEQFSSQTTFTITLQRDPRSYQIRWERQQGGSRTPGLLWNSGEGPHLGDGSRGPNLGNLGGGSARSDERMAFTFATDISGAPAFIPSLFFPGIGMKRFPSSDSAKFNGTETVDGVPCRIVEVSGGAATVHRFWIDDELLIRRKQEISTWDGTYRPGCNQHFRRPPAPTSPMCRIHGCALRWRNRGEKWTR